MTETERLPACFAGFPGVVLQVSMDGVVVRSNGRLERELGRPVIGTPFESTLDSPTCGEKWSRVLSAASKPDAALTCELVFARDGVVEEPRSFSVLSDTESGLVWLVEHPTDPRMEHVRREITAINSELSNAQRDLVRERGRLAHALSVTERLAAQVKAQNEALGEQNEELIVMTEELDGQRRELERTNRALDEFAHVISHDLKAPLRSVANYARWIEEDLAGALIGETRAHMELLRGQVDRMRAMIDGVLEYARSGRTRAPKEVVDVEELMQEVIALLHPPANVRIELATPLPTLFTERTPLRQVLLNLVGNAIKHARRPDVHVRIAVVDSGDAFDFSVQDNGPGIARRMHEKIWTLFHTFTPHNATGNGVDGTGVGLAIVRQLVELQGGRAWVESEEGKGATFHFLWPKHSESPPEDSNATARTLLDAS